MEINPIIDNETKQNSYEQKFYQALADLSRIIGNLTHFTYMIIMYLTHFMFMMIIYLTHFTYMMIMF